MARRADDVEAASVGVESVITTAELSRRPTRSPDFAVENRVLLKLANTMAQEPRRLLQELVDSARALCRAGSAGISLLDPGTSGSNAQFRWVATSGDYGPLAGNTMPRHFSPCGTVLDRNHLLLMTDPIRHFPYIEALPQPAHEVLLVPFYRGAEPIGTVWVAAHTSERQFDQEDARLVTSLSQFAAAAIQVIQTAEALRASEAELREADRQKDEFLAVLAHELRNPLVPIRNGIELLKRVREHPLIEKVRPMMERQVGHAVHLIDDLLDISRIRSGKVVLQRELVTVTDLVASAVEANRGAIAEAGLELEVDLEDPERLLEVDATRLPQVISNILHNATKFTPRGGKIILRTEFASHGMARPELILRVIDTGVGIPKESLPKVFGLFTQVHADSAVRHGGLGIGLALARKLVELHGGSIGADSAGPGQGSVFTIRIPAPMTRGEGASVNPAVSDNLAGLRVLVVDDNRDAADSLGLLIAELGAVVRTAYDGTQALEVLKDFDPSLVLLDIGMPDLDGYQACERIRRDKGGAVSIVAVTGWGQEADRRRTAQAGFNAHLTKPVELGELVALAASARSHRGMPAPNA